MSQSTNNPSDLPTMYLVYRVANSFFATPIALHRFLIYSVIAVAQHPSMYGKLYVNDTSLTRKRLLFFRPNYKDIEFNYYLVNKEDYDVIFASNKLHGTYRGNRYQTANTFIKDIDVEYLHSRIHIKDFGHFLDLKEVFHIENHQIDYSSHVFTVNGRLAKYFKERGII